MSDKIIIEKINTMLKEIGSDFKTEDGNILIMYIGHTTFLKKTFNSIEETLKFVTDKYNQLQIKQ